MCIAVWTLEHPDYALIIGENRDEFIDRPTQDAHWHSFNQNLQDDEGTILSGRDEKAGGSWFGINRGGRVALLTNITEPLGQYKSTRGYLISSFLLSNSTHPLEDEVGKIISPDAVFAGFNLLLLAPSLRPDSNSIFYDALFVTNHGGGGALTSRPLTASERQCGCMSNGIDGQGASDWPKVKHAMEDFTAILQQEQTQAEKIPGHCKNSNVKLDTASTTAAKDLESELVDGLFELLTWRCSDPVTTRPQLRNTVQVAPIPIVLESATSLEASDPLTKIPAVYATRLSTVLLIKRSGEVCFVERDIWLRGADGRSVVNVDSPPNQREFRFSLDVDAIRKI